MSAPPGDRPGAPQDTAAGAAAATGTDVRKDTEALLRRAVGMLEEDIAFGRLHPNQRLTEDALIVRFDLKRHVARDALATLERMGLVERRRNVGALVRAFTPRQVEELYVVRELLEAEAARLIPLPVPPERLAPLEAIQRRHDEAVAAHDAAAVFRANLAFHAALFGLCGNDTLRGAIAEYARQTHPIRFSTHLSDDYRARSRAEHWRMIAALADGDREALVAACRAHLAPSRDAYLEANRHRLRAASSKTTS